MRSNAPSSNANSLATSNANSRATSPFARACDVAMRERTTTTTTTTTNAFDMDAFAIYYDDHARARWIYEIDES